MVRKPSFITLITGALFVTFMARSALDREEFDIKATEIMHKSFSSLSADSSSGEESDSTSPSLQEHWITGGKETLSSQVFVDSEGRLCVYEVKSHPSSSIKKIPSFATQHGVVFFPCRCNRVLKK